MPSRVSAYSDMPSLERTCSTSAVAKARPRCAAFAAFFPAWTSIRSPASTRCPTGPSMIARSAFGSIAWARPNSRSATFG
jgi:hypothetical protein